MHPQSDPRVLSILREARRQFIVEGFAGTRIEPIARDASVSTATLYTFFESKSVLFEAVIKEAGAELHKKFEGLDLKPPYNKEKLTQCMVSYADTLFDPFVRKMFWLIISERPRFSEAAAEFFDKGRGNIAYTLIAMLDQMNAEGIIHVEKTSWAVSQLLGMVEHPLLLLPIATGRDPAISRTPKTIAEDAVQTFWARYAVSSSSGVKAHASPTLDLADELHPVM